MDDNITRIVVRYAVPAMQIYGLYVIFHGHLSPGGGFAGGIVLGVGMILYAPVFGLKSGLHGVEMETLTAVSVAALTVYDMCKAVDKSMVITDVRLELKEGGKSGLFKRVREVNR